MQGVGGSIAWSVSPSSLDVALISALKISKFVVGKSTVKIHLPIKKNIEKEYYGSKGIAFFQLSEP